MAHSQPFYGKLTSVSPVNSNIVITTGDFVNGSNQFTIADAQLVRVGQTLTYVNSQFTGTVTITNVSGTTITVDQNANSNAGSGQTIGLNTEEGTYFIPSSSFLDPQGFITVNDITGSADTDFNGSTPIYAFLGQAATGGGTAITGRFHEYKISEIVYRNGGSSEMSMFVEWNEDGTQSDSGDQLFIGSNQSLPIVGLTPSESLAPIFSNELNGLTGMTLGSELAGYQIILNNFLDDLVTTDVFYTGSRVESNLENLNFTGSGVTVTSSGSRGVLINIPGGGGGGSTDTGSLLTTASAANNVITFTKGDASTFTVTVDTGSGGGSLFPYTGSAEITGSLEVIGFTNLTGSTFIQGTTGNDALAVSDSSGDKKFSVNSEGVVVLEEQTSEPTAVEGGIYYSHSQFYFGIE
jgi:hypothetical protein